MTHLVFNNCTEAYYSLLSKIYNEPEYESSPRDMKIKESLGCSFKILNIRDRIPYIKERNFSTSYLISELLWYFSGNNSTKWISNYSKFWKNISDDGLTANSAYGARIFKNHPYQNFLSSKEFDHSALVQWEEVKAELKRDQDSRRAVIHIRMPQDSVAAKKDVPCTLTLQFFIRDGALHQVASMRSSDLIFGLAYDIPAFTMFQELLAFELNVDCGHYIHISGSLHIYERHFKMVEEILTSYNKNVDANLAKPMPPLPSLPPVEMMMNWESKFRNCKTKLELQKTVDDFVDFSSINGINQYWKDWVFILAAHKAKKLKAYDYQNLIMTLGVKFEGYKFSNV